MPQVQVEVPYKENYDLGVGVDLATGSPMGMVVQGAVKEGVTGAGGAVTSFNISRIHTTSDLETTLGINVEASGGCGLFSASGRFNFVEKSKIQSSSLFMAITSIVELANLSIPDPGLTPQAIQIAERADAFATRYGNMFVRGIGRGGLFIGVMRIDTSSSEDSESISAEIGGSYGLFSAKASTTFENIQKKYHGEIHITVYHEGGPIDLSMDQITDANQLYLMLRQWLTAFQQDPAKNSVAYSVTLSPIEIANGPIPPNAADLQNAQDVLVICARERSMILDGLNLMEFISQNPSRFDYVAPTTPADIVKALAGYQADLLMVGKAASLAMDNPKQALPPAEFAAQHGRPYPQGVPPTPMPELQKGEMDTMAAKGEIIASQDPLATELRNQQPEGQARRGFDIGMAAAEGHTLDGPGKQRRRDLLKPGEQDGYSIAVAFSVMRNANAALAATGVAIEKVEADLLAARNSNTSPFYRLGFDIATGLFGDPALNGGGQTAWGPGKQKRRDSLNELGQRGFDDSQKMHWGPPPRQRR